MRTNTVGSTPRFAYAVSNPPYQVATTAQNIPREQATVTNVFQYFQQAAQHIADVTSMIYPGGRWLQSSGKGLREFSTMMLEDHRFVSVEYYTMWESREIFGDVYIPDGVSITYWNRAVDNNGVVLLNGHNVVMRPGDIMPLQQEYIYIIEKVKQVMRDRGWVSLNGRIAPRTQFGIESNYAALNPDRVFLIADYPTPPAALQNPVKILTNDTAGRNGRPKWFWIDRDDIPLGHDDIDKWKFVIKSAQFAYENKQIHNGFVVESGSVFGRSRVSLAMFDTREAVENFAQYIRTPFMQNLYLQSVSGGLTKALHFVPDIGDYTETAILDWQQPLEPQLYTLFGLNDDEIQIVEQQPWLI